MFSGIVEGQGQIIKIENRSEAIRLWVSRPESFDDLRIGDSVACDGVCLTVEGFSKESIQFTIAFETLQLLKITPENLLGRTWNLERSLRFGDRVHGHLVTGHVEGLGAVVRSESLGDSWLLDVKIPKDLTTFVWKKGSIALQGVSLTVNSIEADVVSVCLIPETQARTNLSAFRVGDFINVETDYMAKALLRGRSIEV